MDSKSRAEVDEVARKDFGYSDDLIAKYCNCELVGEFCLFHSVISMWMDLKVPPSEDSYPA